MTICRTRWPGCQGVFPRPASSAAADGIPRHIPTKLPIRVDGEVAHFLRLSKLRGDYPALAGQVRILRRVEYDRRGGGGARNRRGGDAARRRRTPISARRPVGTVEGRPTRHHWDRRTRPGGGGRLRPRLGDADRWGAGHRQIDALDPGLRRRCAFRGPHSVRVGRGIDRAGPPARRPTRTGRSVGAGGRSNPGRGHCRDSRVRRSAEARRHRFDPDHVERHDRIRRPERSVRSARPRRP